MDSSLDKPNVTAEVERRAPAFDPETVQHDNATTVSSATTATTADSHESKTRANTPVQNDRVDVARAENEFRALAHELTKTSSLHRAATGTKDFEKEGDEHDDFDLLDYLRGQRGEEDESGFKHKELGVVWDDLTVVGAGGMKIFIRTFPDAVKQFIMSPAFMVLQFTSLFAPRPKNLLEDFNGFARPGEMVLVLGRPGSGCTTFLKTIANERGGYLDVKGDVTYGGIEAATMKKRYRGEVVYNQEDDVHHATLTVAQTLKFALNTKVRLSPFIQREND